MPQSLIPFETWSDGRTVRVTVALSVLVAGIVALAPLFLHRGDRVGDVLRGAGRGIVAGRSRLRSALLVVQAALSVALLIGAVLFVRSLDRLRAVPLGYDAQSVLLVRPTVRASAGAGVDRVLLREALLARARMLPGVSAASWTTFAPLTMSAAVRLHVPGIDSVNALGQFTQQDVAPGYFEAAGTRILSGRAITRADYASAPPVVVISLSMARTLWPVEDALGKCIHIGPETAPCTTVVGIAEDIADSGPADASRLHFYLPWEQSMPRMLPPMRAMLEGSATLVLRVRSQGRQEAEAIRRALQPLMPSGSWISVQPMSDLVDRSMQSWQLGATLFSGFGGLALVIAAVGLYGVIAYEAAQRRPELGIRIALGAQRPALLWLVLRRSTFFALTGVVLGTAVAFATGPWLEPLLFEQPARDPAVYAGVALLMAAIALAAGAAPAASAAGTDPNKALRCE